MVNDPELVNELISKIKAIPAEDIIEACKRVDDEDLADEITKIIRRKQDETSVRVTLRVAPDKEKLTKIYNVFKNIRNHIVYDHNIKDICYSAAYIKARDMLLEYLEGELDLNEE